MAKTKLPALGINIYGGGFTLGALQHFDVRGQWEEDPLGRDTFDLNFGHTDIYRPLQREEWPVEANRGAFPFIYANPPCAPWSSANTRAGYTKDKRFLDKRLALTAHTVEAAQAMLPEVFISESVENAWNIGASHYDQYIDSWINLGYHVTILLTDAILHGLPSMRRRFHFIAHRYALQLRTPDLQNFKPTTVRDAIWDIKDQVGHPDLLQHDAPTPQRSRGAGFVGPTEILAMTPYGGRAREVERELHEAGRYDGPYSSFLVKRVMWDAPAFTMVGLSKLIHPDGERLLTWREGMRLMSFPDWFLAKREIEAADSVTPLMGEYLSKIAFDCIKTKEKNWEDPETGYFHLIDWRPMGRPFQISNLKKTLVKA